MDNPRTYGPPPYRVAVLHGGPGAGGEMAPVARRLSAHRGVLEPIQTATSVNGQVHELRAALEAHADLPGILIGYSWGAWLGFILAARHPDLVRKLILVSSGPFEQRYVADLGATRSSRLTPDERTEFKAIAEALSGPPTPDQDARLARLGALAEKTDAYDPLPAESEPGDPVEAAGAVFQGVWPEAAGLRRSGALLDLGRRIRCPVTAIHGDHDPHPAAGVRDPLSRVLEAFRFDLLAKCGHTPWRERQAVDRFYELLEEEIR